MKADEQILFPELDVAGHKVRPWVLGQAVALAPTLGSLVDIIGASGVGSMLAEILDSIDAEKATVSSVGNVFKAGWKDVVKALPGLMPKFIPLAPKILAVSLGVSEEEVARFDLGKTTTLLKAVGVLNYDYLKNYFGPGVAGKEAEVA